MILFAFDKNGIPIKQPCIDHSEVNYKGQTQKNDDILYF